MEILILLLVIGVGVLIWRSTGQDKRISAAEFELTRLRDIVLGMRGRLETGASPALAETPTASRTVETASAPLAPADAAPEKPEAFAEKPEAAAQSAEPLANAETGPEDSAGPAPLPSPWGAAKESRSAAVSPAPVAAKAPAARGFDFESSIATRWPIWVGGLAFALGGIFLVRYSIERGFFGPGIRLAMSAIAGLAAMAGGEFLRRRDIKLAFAGDSAAQVPAILTAAGAAILFAVVYAAHAYFGFIGPAAAFILLGVISLATLGLSLLHGSPLAGLGLLGAFVTPVLVASNAPNDWALFVYLGVVLAAAALLARFRDLSWIMAAAAAGQGGWMVLRAATDGPPLVILFAAACSIGAAALVWLNRRGEADAEELLRLSVPPAIAAALAALSGLLLLGWFDYSAPAPDWIPVLAIAALLLALGVRHAAGLAGLAGAAMVGLIDMAVMVRLDTLSGSPDGSAGLGHASLSGLMFFASGAAMARRQAHQTAIAAMWALAGSILPFAAWGSLVFINADWNFDWAYGLSGLVLAGLFAATAMWLRKEHETPLFSASSIFLTAAALFLLVAVHLLTGSAWTGIGLAAIALALAWVSARREHPLLPWLACAFGIAVFTRFGFDPAIAAALSVTPVFNWLLAGYGLPALAFAASAWLFAQQKELLPQRIMEGMAATASIAGTSMLIRHGMNGGVLEFHSAPTLAEQAVYTLMALGASGTLIRLDVKSPSPVFRIGSMLIGYAGMVTAFLQHFLHLNPLWTNENTGGSEIFNLLSMAYLLPAIATGALWFYATARRPAHYVLSLGVMTFLFLAFFTALGVRHWYAGPLIGFENGVEAAELLSYLPKFIGLAAFLFFVSRYFLAGMARPLGWGFAASGTLLFAPVTFLFANPLLTGEETGASHVFNLVGLGFFVPMLGYAALRFLAAPQWEAWRKPVQLALGVATGLCGFAWASLTVRHVWQGSSISIDRFTETGEIYTYSVVWLLIGLALLGLGARFSSRPLRFASALMVTLTTLKVFLIDMSSLEGVLRAFSFMGLGLALIGIGLLYQRVLTQKE